MVSPESGAHTSCSDITYERLLVNIHLLNY